MANRLLNVFLGGDSVPGVFNADFQMFPRPDVEECDKIDLACHKAASPVYLNRVLDTCASNPCEASCGPDEAFLQYIKYLGDQDAPLEVDDCLGIIILPRWTELMRFRWQIDIPAPGLTFEVRRRSNNQVFLANLDAGLGDPCEDDTLVNENTGVVDLWTLNGNAPMYMDRTDVLDLRVTGLPANGVPCQTDNCFRIDVGVLIQPLCAGQF